MGPYVVILTQFGVRLLVTVMYQATSPLCFTYLAIEKKEQMNDFLFSWYSNVKNVALKTLEKCYSMDVLSGREL